MWEKEKPTLLIVEDDVTNHPLFEDAYGQVGFEVIIYRNAEGDFAGTVSEHKPDLISMDLMIGQSGIEVKRDGFEAIRLLKSDDRTNTLPIIVVSNFVAEEKVKAAKALGAVDYYNLQGQPITQVAKRFREFVNNPKKYKPSHPLFRE